MERELTQELRARLRGRLWSPAPRSTCRDFGRVDHREPAVVVQPHGEADVIETLAVCRERGVPLVVRGAGHSCGGQTLLEGGVVLWNRADEPDASQHGDEVEVCGRSTWNGLEAFLGARGRTAMILPDHLELTVGGTLSVGGYGVRSVAWGSQVDRVSSLRVITPDGQARWLPADDPLARRVLAGVGTLGVIERVRMPTLPARPAASWCSRSFDGLGPMARWLRWVEAVEHPDLWLDAWWADDVAVAEWGLEAPDPERAKSRLVPGPPPERERLAWHLPLLLHDKRWRWVTSFPDHRRLWIDLMMPHAPFVALCERLDRLRAEGGRPPTAAYLLVSRAPPGHVPAVASPSPWPVSYGLGLYFMVPPGESSASAERTIELLRREGEALGARPYRYGYGAEPPWDEEIERLRDELGAGEWFSPRRRRRSQIDDAGLVIQQGRAREDDR